jgi:hypothetical protein
MQIFAYQLPRGVSGHNWMNFALLAETLPGHARREVILRGA